MGTDKRERQKANRATRVAAAEDAARKARMRSRMITYGLIAAAVVAAIVGFAWLASDDDSGSAADSADPLEQLEDALAEGDLPDPTADPADTTSAVDPADTTPNAVEAEFVYGEGECPAEDGSSEPRLQFDGPPPLCIDPSASHIAVFDTSEGEIRIALDTAGAPGTVNNFVTLARWGYYDGTTIFRTDPSIDIIQGGAPTTNSPADPGPGYTISDEPTFDIDPASGQPVGPYTYQPGQLVMARSAGINSAGAQFFLTAGPNASALDSQGTYVIFGTTDELTVLETIIGLHEDDPSSQLGGGPSRTVTVESVTIEVS